MIDSLRGFSLLGIILVNMLFFQYGDNTDKLLEGANGINQLGYYATKILIEGSFYPIFAFLFGYSLIKLVESVKHRQPKSRWVIIRRAIGLIIIGALHYVLVWDGDILMMYGLSLFTFLIFIKREAKTCFIWAALISIVMLIFMFFVGSSFNLTEESGITEARIAALTNGSYLEIIESRIEMVVEEDELNTIAVAIIFGLILVVITPIMIGPFVLVGIGIAKKGLLTNKVSEQRYYKKWIWLLPVGLILKSCIVLDGELAEFAYLAGGAVLSAGYIAAFALLYQSKWELKMQASFANIGRMSMTNYLMQSIICTTVFYGYGFGLFAKLGAAGGIVLAIVIFIGQIQFSNWYMARWQQGPVEKLLRAWTYYKVPPKKSEETIELI